MRVLIKLKSKCYETTIDNAIKAQTEEYGKYFIVYTKTGKCFFPTENVEQAEITGIPQ